LKYVLRASNYEKYFLKRLNCVIYTGNKLNGGPTTFRPKRERERAHISRYFSLFSWRELPPLSRASLCFCPTGNFTRLSFPSGFPRRDALLPPLLPALDTGPNEGFVRILFLVSIKHSFLVSSSQKFGSVSD
jgi:hypothetical protein